MNVLIFNWGITCACRRKLFIQSINTWMQSPKSTRLWKFIGRIPPHKYVNYATALTAQGLIYSQTGRMAEAEQLLRESARIRSENMPEAHFLRATANGALGEFLTTQERFGEAEPLLVKATRAWRNRRLRIVRAQDRASAAYRTLREVAETRSRSQVSRDALTGPGSVRGTCVSVFQG